MALIEKPATATLTAQGLFFKTLAKAGPTGPTGSGAAARSAEEASLGPYPETTLEQARIKHAELRALVLKGIDPVANRRAARTAVAAKADAPTFGTMADQYIAAHEAGWRNAKHRYQWEMSFANTPRRSATCQSMRSTPRRCSRRSRRSGRLRPKPRRASEEVIEVILASAQVAGWIDADKPNPARWRGWLDHMLPPAKKLGVRGHHAAMPYAELPAFMAKLAEINTTASRALMFTILCASRTSETLGAQWDEVNFGDATWRVPGERMKMGEPHDIPLSDAALRILGDQMAGRGKNPYVFPGGRPRQPLSSMAMAMLLRRLGVDATVHGFRTSFRTWASEVAHAEFEIAEAALAHQIGNSVSRAYNRTSLLERRRPLMESWSRYVEGNDNVIAIKPRVRAPYRRA